jgi:hypothetical protein
MSDAKKKRYLYILGPSSGEAVKIGRSIDPVDRLKQTQVHNHKDLELFKVYAMGGLDGSDAHHVETLVKEGLKDHHIRGEWYGLTPKHSINMVDDFFKRGVARRSRKLKDRLAQPGIGNVSWQTVDFLDEPDEED